MEANMTVEHAIELCNTLYTSVQAEHRVHAEENLRQWAAQNPLLLLRLLTESSSPYALMYAALSLVQWFRTTRATLGMDLQGTVVSGALDAARRLFLANQPRYVVASVMGACAKLLKMTYEKEPVVSTVVDDAVAVLRQISAGGAATMGGDAGHQEKCFAVLTLNSIVQEMTTYETTKSALFLTFAAHRRCSTNFRDKALLSIFEAVVRLLPPIPTDPAVPLSSGELMLDPQRGSPPLGDLLSLLKSILSYDFMAIMLDETEEITSAQFPSSWRDVLLTQGALQVLWALLHRLPLPHCTSLMQGMAAACGMRRTFFDTQEEKHAFLELFCGALVRLDPSAASGPSETSPGLPLASSPSVHATNADARLGDPMFVTTVVEGASRLIPPHGYVTLRRIASFQPLIMVLKAWTLKALAVPFGESGSMGTTTALMQWWVRLCTSKRLYNGEDAAQMDLEVLLPDVVVQMVRSRVCRSGVRALEVDEDACEVMAQQSATLPSLIWLNPGPMLQQLASELQGCRVEDVVTDPIAFSWLLFFVAAIIRLIFSGLNESMEAGCTSILNYTVNACFVAHQNGAIRELTEPALIAFLTQLQSTFSAVRLTTILTRMVNSIFGDRVKLFQFILELLGHNMLRPLQSTSSSVDIIAIVRSSVELIAETCRQMPATYLTDVSLQLPPVQQLPISQSVQAYKLRTNLYTALWMLRGEQSDAVASFFPSIEEMMAETTSGRVVSTSFTAGWLRDLRGITRGAANNVVPLCALVEWALERSDVFLGLARLRSAEGTRVVISLLRFLAELLTPARYGRVNLPPSHQSAIVISLFRFLCSVIQEVLQAHITTEELDRMTAGSDLAAVAASTASSAEGGLYRAMLKPLTLCMDIIRRSVLVDFLPLGAMSFYEDRTYDQTVAGLLRYLLIFPYRCMRQYPKIIMTMTDFLRSIIECGVTTPLVLLTPPQLVELLDLMVEVTVDVEVNSTCLLHALTFLQHFAALISVAKVLLGNPPSNSGDVRTPSALLGSSSAAMLHNASPPTRATLNTQEQLASHLLQHKDIWFRMLEAAMAVVLLQDRCISPCSQLIYPIVTAERSLWVRLMNELLQNTPPQKQEAMQALLVPLSAAETQEIFFAEMFNLRNGTRSM